jgi:BirA family transcriptional regulator, biotin operon repressor / biotin---[acetyl-CoA-carboxylase] ligase
MPLLDPDRLKSVLGPVAGRFAVTALAECDSTSSELMRRADAGAVSGSVVVADRQTAGRGRRGRTWLSAPASSLTFSLLWRFNLAPGQLAGLSLAAGVALARSLERLGARGVRLKWPNDILLEAEGGHAKLAGILVELVTDRHGAQAIIGIGLNLQPPADALPQPAAGLAEAMQTLPERYVVLAVILQELAVVLDAVAVDGFSGGKMEWQQRPAWQGCAVCLLGDGDAALEGICAGVDDDGALLLETGGGIRRIVSGDVSLRPA